MVNVPAPRADLASIHRLPGDQDGTAIQLGDSTNLWGPCPAAIDVLREGVGDVAGYPTPYSSDLKAALAAYHGVSPDEVVTGCGSDDVIRSAMGAFATAGDRVAWMEPTFVIIPVFARLLGLDARPVRFAPGFDVDARALLATDAAVTYLCSPNNPTGTAATRASQSRVIDAARGLVIIDEAYADYSGETWVDSAPQFGRLLVTRTFSKSFGLAGLRVGYGVGHADVVAAVEKARGPFTVNALAERAAVAAVSRGVPWMRATVAVAVQNRQRLTGELAAMGLAPLPSVANFLLVPVPDALAVVAVARRHGLIVRAFMDLPVVGNAVRASVGPWPVMERLVAAFREALG
jgi:histidinol-phosphate aminotransferase